MTEQLSKLRTELRELADAIAFEIRLLTWWEIVVLVGGVGAIGWLIVRGGGVKKVTFSGTEVNLILAKEAAKRLGYVGATLSAGGSWDVTSSNQAEHSVNIYVFEGEVSVEDMTTQVDADLRKIDKERTR